MIEVYDDWTCDDLNIIENLIFENGFTYEISDTTVEGMKSLRHPIQLRIENTNYIPKPTSHLYHLVMKIIYRFCFEKNIDFQMVCRSAINYSHPRDGLFYLPHTDHDYEHKNILIYLNDSDGDTVFWNNERVEIKRVSPKKGRIVIFDGNIMHSTDAPKEKERLVLVTTIA